MLNILIKEDLWIYHESCLDSFEIINLHGFTMDPDTLNFMAVMDYANKGNLRGNLTKVIKNNWKQKLYMLYKIIFGLYKLHKESEENEVSEEDEESGKSEVHEKDEESKEMKKLKKM
ncbi:unnamed protein product [Rhizophagus irregularis]|nr:unnamed protein product [Rhizophagus irregularis]